MGQLHQLKQDPDLLNAIDWDMTPEEAIRLYLEWGNNWARGNYVIRSKNDATCYFAISTWKKEPVIYLIRRTSEGAEELAAIRMPHSLQEAFFEQNGRLKGVYAVEGVVKEWLQKELIGK